MSELIRPEYDTSKNAGLYEPALTSLEDLMSVGEHIGFVSESSHDGAARRQMDMYRSEDSADEYAVLFSDFTTVSLERAPVQTEAQLVLESYRTGPLQHMARMSVRAFVANSPYPFISEYQLETYVGGSVQALVSTTDVVQGEGLEARRMVPYDFDQLSRIVMELSDRASQLVGERRRYE